MIFLRNLLQIYLIHFYFEDLFSFFLILLKSLHIRLDIYLVKFFDGFSNTLCGFAAKCQPLCLFFSLCFSVKIDADAVHSLSVKFHLIA